MDQRIFKTIDFTLIIFDAPQANLDDVTIAL